jgi:hypothetical protein
MDLAETRMENNLRRGRQGRSEGERGFVEAQQIENLGDGFTALARYQALAKRLAESPEDRPFFLLARREAARLEKLKPTAEERRTAVETQLAEAEARFAADEALEARRIWKQIVAVYADEADLAEFVERAKDRLAGKPAETQEAP